MKKMTTAELEDFAKKLMECSYGIKDADVTIGRVSFSWFEFFFKGYAFSWTKDPYRNNSMPYIDFIGLDETKRLMKNYKTA